MQIREMIPQDRKRLRELYLESRRQTFYWNDPLLMHEEDFDRDTQDEQIFVAIEQQQIVGFISIYLPEDFIHCLFIQHEFQGLGIGHLLMQQAKKVTQRPIRLKCLSRNLGALAFYEKEGWQKVHEVKLHDPYWEMIFQD